MTTETAQLVLLRYPIGGPKKGAAFTPAERDAAIEEIARFPGVLRSAVQGWTAGQLDTSYRPGGWRVRQLIHHVADSHINAYCRVRLALTADPATIFAYPENLWAELEDARDADVAISLDLLTALHARWVRLFRSLGEIEWKKSYVHPDNGPQSVEQAVMLYDWHGRHHTAHITQLAARMGW